MEDSLSLDAPRPDGHPTPASGADGIVVAVDGPSGSGKSSVSRAVATRLGLRYLDTGSLYRAMAWWMLHRGIDITSADAVAAACVEPTQPAGTDPQAPTITADGIDVAGPIRGREVTSAVSPVSAVPQVRARLTALQREVIGSGGIVVEGRDIGTVIAPDARVKVYLTADPSARAARRQAELPTSAGATVDTTQAEMARRDRIDSTRTTAPLAKAADAHEIDTTGLTLDEVIDAVEQLVAKTLAMGRA
jgi:cytidylate kinase